MTLKRRLKKIWYFLWEEDSILSWVANVVLAFVIIKFMLYPGLGFVLGTPAPIVAVVSGSMEHDGNFDNFWTSPMCCNGACTKKIVQGEYYQKLNISEEKFRTFDFVNGFNKGDIMILYSAENMEVGDVIVYTTPYRSEPIIHRSVRIEDKDGVLTWTKGDHNCDIGQFEEHIPKERIIGKAIWRVPLLGWVKIGAVWLWSSLGGSL